MNLWETSTRSCSDSDVRVHISGVISGLFFSLFMKTTHINQHFYKPIHLYIHNLDCLSFEGHSAHHACVVLQFSLRYVQFVSVYSSAQHLRGKYFTFCDTTFTVYASRWLSWYSELQKVESVLQRPGCVLFPLSLLCDFSCSSILLWRGLAFPRNNRRYAWFVSSLRDPAPSPLSSLHFSSSLNSLWLSQSPDFDL